MSEVSLSIGGRSYKVACAPGEEDHVSRLAAAIDAKLETMPHLSAQDAQNLLFAALLLADDLHEARNANTTAQDEAARAREEAERHRTEAERLQADAADAEEQRRAVGAIRRELDDLRQAEAALRAELDAAKASEAELRAELAGLAQERDGLRGELDQAHSAPASGALPLDDPELAPALERFAELLETCAEKLEGKAGNP